MRATASTTAVVDMMNSTASTSEVAPAEMPEEPPVDPNRRGGHSSSARQILESLACLAIAVILFRTFEIEGYMISTGSMAPTLLGYHKRVECPNCGHQFAYGIAVDETRPGVLSSPHRVSAAPHDEPLDVMIEHDTIGNDDSTPRALEEKAVCPNCGREVTGIEQIPANQGDQLLVHKNAYAFHPPRRWDVAVFQNPSRPTQAYVKRIVGLPNELLEVVDGDVFADGHICRKNLSLQRAIRINVYDNDCRPEHDSEWRPRWIAETNPSVWQAVGGTFQATIPAAASRQDDDFAWVKYRHWMRRGTRGRTYVLLEPHEGQISIPELSETPVGYDPADGTIGCSGALTTSWRDRLLADSRDPVFRHAVEKLYEKSHLTPVGDSYGYNEPTESDWLVPVRDLMISLEIEPAENHGDFVVEMTDGRQAFRAVLNFETRELNLLAEGEAGPVRSGKWAKADPHSPLLLEMSLIDRQVLVAVDGHEPFEPWPIVATTKATTPTESPVRIGVRGVSLTARRIHLFRDVYYTHKGNNESVTLGPVQYYVLGDNSPISFDSRSWENPAVEAPMLIGKPLFLHLPSRPGEFTLGEQTYHIRIPDFTRIHYIR